MRLSLVLTLAAAFAAALALGTGCDGDPEPGVMRLPKPKTPAVATTEPAGLPESLPATAPSKTSTESAPSANTAILPASAPSVMENAIPAAPVRSKKELIADGERIFKRKKCSQCHKTSGVFPSQGPNLADVSTRLNEQQMRVWIDNPAKQKPDTKMPPWDGTPAEFDALIAFLRSI